MKSSKKVSVILIIGVIVSLILALLAIGEKNNVFKLRDKLQESNMQAAETSKYFPLQESASSLIGGTLNLETGVLSISGSSTSATLPNVMKSVAYVEDGNSIFGEYKDLIKKITIDGRYIKNIGSNVFANCSNLEEVEITGGSLIEIGSGAFKNCESLKKVTLNGYIQIIDNEAFYNTDLSNGITFNNNILKIGKSAFENSNIPSVTIPGRGTSYDPNTTRHIGENAFKNCDNLSSVSIGKNIDIGDYSFEGCDNLTDVYLEKYSVIGMNPFANCSKLETITSEVSYQNVYTTSSNTSLMCYTVDGVLYRYSELVCYPAHRQDAQYSIPASTTTLACDAFSGNDILRQVTLSASVNTVVEPQFRGCTKLEEILVSVNNVYFKSENNVLFSNDGKTLYNYPLNKYGTQYTVTAENIGSYAFYNNKKLKTINATNGVKTIGDYAFYGNSALETFNMSQSMTEIRDYAFYDCQKLETINDKSDNITRIGCYAFYNCIKYDYQDMPANIKSIGDHAFTKSKLTKIIIPDNTYIENHTFAIADNAFSDCKYIEEIELPRQDVRWSNRGMNICENTVLTLNVTLNSDGKYEAHLPKAIPIDIYYNESKIKEYPYLCKINDDNVIKIDEDSDNVIDDNIVTMEREDIDDAYIEITEGHKRGLLDGLTIKFSRGGIGLTGIEIAEQPETKTYYEGDSFDKTGMVVKAVYSNGEKVTLSEQDYEVTPDPLTYGTTQVAVIYEDKAAVVSGITVNKVLLDSIEITELPSKEFFDGDEFDKDGIVAIAHYNNGSTKEVQNEPLFEVFPSNGTVLHAGETTINVAYTEEYEGTIEDRTRQASATIVVKPIEVIKIRITTRPTKQSYIEGESLDLSGMLITAYYNNGTQEVIGDDEGEVYTVNPAEGTEVTFGLNEVTISYGGQSTTLRLGAQGGEPGEDPQDEPIPIVEKQLIGIDVTTLPSKLCYVEGETFDTTGMVVKASYDNGKTETIENGYEITPNGPLTLDNHEVTITYQGQTATVNISVEKEEDLREITFADQNMYRRINEELNDMIYVKDEEHLTIKMLPEDINNVTFLNLNNTRVSENSRIRDISGLENFINLNELWLVGNRIDDLSQFKNLQNLKILYLSSNNIETLNGFEELPTDKLEELDLSYNQIKDISILGRFKNLKALYLSYNTEISDISILSELTNLEILHIENNQVEDISSLDNLVKLEYLFADNNKIKNIEYLDNLVKITRLFLRNNQIEDAQVLDNMPEEQLIYLQMCHLDEQNITKTTADGTVDLPQIFIQAKDEESILYTGEDFETTNCSIINNKVVMDEDKDVATVKIIGGKAKNTLLTVNRKNITSIGISCLTDKTCYLEGQTFDRSSIKVEVIYDDNTRETVEDYEIIPDRPLTVNDSQITVTYKGHSTTLDIRVEREENLREITFVDTNMYRKINEELGDKIFAKDLNTLTIKMLPEDIEGVTELELCGEIILGSSFEETNVGNSNYISQGEESNYSLEEIIARRIRNVSGIEAFVNLETLDLSFNYIEDLSQLKNLPNLKNLYLLENDLEDISKLGELPDNKLEVLALTYNQIPDISVIGRFKNLKELYLYNDNELSDISILSELTNLEVLDLGADGGITDISSLAELTKLRLLNISCANIDGKIRILSNLTNLEDLNLEFTETYNLEPLRNLTKLTRLNLCGNNISDIEPIASLPNLTYLNLRFNYIEDVSLLENMNDIQINCESQRIYRYSEDGITDLPQLFKASKTPGSKVYTEEDLRKYKTNIVNEKIILTSGVQEGNASIMGGVADSSAVYLKRTAEPAPTSIEVKYMPDKTEYVKGEFFEPSGMEVVLHYQDGRTQVLEDNEYDIAPITPLTTDDTKVTISYPRNSEDQLETSINITVTDNTPQVIHVTGVRLNKTSTTINVDPNPPLLISTNLLGATITPEDAANKNVTWISSNEEIVIVEEITELFGRPLPLEDYMKPAILKGIAPGTAEVTVITEDGEFTATCTVTVVEEEPPVINVESVSLNKKGITLGVSQSEKLIATVNPEDATNKNVTWESLNEEVATVDEEGNVTAIAPGTADIKVTTVDGEKTAVCRVKVFENVTHVTGITLNKEETTIEIGGEEKLRAILTPEDATNKNVLWSTSNVDIVSVDGGGNITGEREGTAIITATTEDGELTASCEVTVIERTEPEVIHVENVSLNKSFIQLKIGETDKLDATITPNNATNKAVTWRALDENVATVDNDGNIVAVGEGTTAIVVTTEDLGKQATCIVVVTKPKVDVQSVSLNKEEATLKIGDKEQLIATVLPENATNKNVTWVSLNEEVATVNNEGLVTAIAAGTAEIKVTTVDGEKTAICNITVVKDDNPNPDIEDLFEEDDSYSLNEGYIYGIKTKTRSQTVKDKVNDKYTIIIREKDGETEVSQTKYIGTGMIMEVYLNNNLIGRYIIIVKGDINGDGKASGPDALLMLTHRKGITLLEGIEFMAGDIVGNDNKINGRDALALLMHRKDMEGYEL